MDVLYKIGICMGIYICFGLLLGFLAAISEKGYSENWQVFPAKQWKRKLIGIGLFSIVYGYLIASVLIEFFLGPLVMVSFFGILALIFYLFFLVVTGSSAYLLILMVISIILMVFLIERTDQLDKIDKIEI